MILNQLPPGFGLIDPLRLWKSWLNDLIKIAHEANESEEPPLILINRRDNALRNLLNYMTSLGMYSKPQPSLYSDFEQMVNQFLKIPNFKNGLYYIRPVLEDLVKYALSFYTNAEVYLIKDLWLREYKRLKLLLDAVDKYLSLPSETPAILPEFIPQKETVSFWISIPYGLPNEYVNYRVDISFNVLLQPKGKVSVSNIIIQPVKKYTWKICYLYITNIIASYNFKEKIFTANISHHFLGNYYPILKKIVNKKSIIYISGNVRNHENEQTQSVVFNKVYLPKNFTSYSIPDAGSAKYESPLQLEDNEELEITKLPPSIR